MAEYAVDFIHSGWEAKRKEKEKSGSQKTLYNISPVTQLPSTVLRVLEVAQQLGDPAFNA